MSHIINAKEGNASKLPVKGEMDHDLPAVFSFLSLLPHPHYFHSHHYYSPFSFYASSFSSSCSFSSVSPLSFSSLPLLFFPDGAKNTKQRYHYHNVFKKIHVKTNATCPPSCSI